MNAAPRRPASEYIGFALVLSLFLGAAAIWIPTWWKNRERQILHKEMIQVLRYPDCNDEGWWVGDITDLYRMGKIPRELAEADTAPLNPLVPTPIPFHGYYVRMMESGPPQTSETDEPFSFKGRKRCRETFAVCFYPADPESKEWAWISSSGWFLRRDGPWRDRSFGFPSPKERQTHWGIID